MNQNVNVIGAPTDIGTGSRGASMGPQALRVAHVTPVLQSLSLHLLDRGKLRVLLGLGLQNTS